MTQKIPSRIELVFYKNANGNMPVRDWLLELDQKNRHDIGADLQRVQFRWPIGMPLVRPLSKGLFEVRTKLSDGTISRVFVCFHNDELYALHAIIKKTQAVPPQALEIARKRQEEVKNG